MKLEELNDMVKNDLKIDDSELARESLNKPLLHNKYNKLLIDQKYILRKKQSEYDRVLLHKSRIFNGTATPEEYEAEDSLYKNLKIDKKELPLYLNADKTLNQFRESLEEHKELVNFIERTIKEIDNRSWSIKNALESNKFDLGG
jgi:hypothetical protein|tara:strand:+ start:4308 stop:4742 length:435 start_codon:yes stop_codon:yes gene_type:complete